VRMSTDNELLHAWRAGDLVAGNTFISSNFDAIYRFFRSKLSGDIDDLVQATFMGCMQAEGDIRDVRALLYAIARRRLVDHLRQQHRHRDHIDWDEVSLHDLGTSPTGALARRQAHAILAEAMRRLPLDWQVVLELTYWEQLSSRDVASVLDVEEPTIRSRIARARGRLRDELGRLTGTTDLSGLETLLVRRR
jgi:RNA polymerase sigma factor (sigma-70 family)